MASILLLSNGKRVANFSSPHEFEFTDGNILPAVSKEEAKRLEITFIEIPENDNGDVSLEFQLSEAVEEEMREWMSMWSIGVVDVVFCPLPMIVAIKEAWGKGGLLNSPFRAIRQEDRIKKLLSVDKQCI
jgi:hypothetical protein